MVVPFLPLVKFLKNLENLSKSFLAFLKLRISLQLVLCEKYEIPSFEDLPPGPCRLKAFAFLITISWLVPAYL
jgi:hypothetical protein